MKKRLTIQQLKVAVGGDPLSEVKCLTLTISGIVPNSEGVGEQFAEFFGKLAYLLQDTFPDFVPDSPPAQLDIDDLEIVE